MSPGFSPDTFCSFHQDVQIQTTGAELNPGNDFAVRPLPELAPVAREHHSSLPPAAPPGHDVGSVLVAEIVASDLPRLAALLEPRIPAELAAQTHQLAHDTEQALAEGDYTRAIANLNQIAATSPPTLAALSLENFLEPVRPEVDGLLNRLTTVAKIDAEGWLAQADHALESPVHPVGPIWQTKPEIVLNLAHRLFESGGYTNYTRSSDLAQSLLNSPSGSAIYSPFLAQYGQSLAPQPAAALEPVEGDDSVLPAHLSVALDKPAAAFKSAALPLLLRVWKRAPLLVLLLGWLGVGLVFGSVSLSLRFLWTPAVSFLNFFFEVWGVGFLALVGFGFYARIRDL